MLKALGFVGYKKSGKTFILTEAAKRLRLHGYRVGTVKNLRDHAIDKEGSDTWRHRQVADYVASFGEEGAILFDRPKYLENLLEIMPPIDVILIEGFRSEKTFPKIICARGEEDVGKIADGLEIGVYGIAGSFHVPIVTADNIAKLAIERGFKLPNYNCGDCGLDCYRMAKAIVTGNRTVDDCMQLSSEVKIRVNGKTLVLNRFMQHMIKNTTIGMLSSLRGFEYGKIDLEIVEK